MNEIVAQPLGVDQRLISFGQRALDADAGRRVDERQQCRAVRQGSRSAVEHRSVAPRKRGFRIRDDGPAAPRRRRAIRPSRTPPTRSGAQICATRSMCGWSSSCSGGSAQSSAKAGLNSFRRPSLPNTATPSLSVSRVSLCTRIAALNCDCR